MLFLEVDYDIKDKVKALGARWNPEIKKWYVEKKEDYIKFAQYILKDTTDAIIVKDYIYLVVTKRICWKCKKETDVIALCIPNRIEFINKPLYRWKNGEFYEESQKYNYKKFNFSEREYEIKNVLSYDIICLGNISKKILDSIKDKYNYKLKYSHTTQSKDYANCCKHCDSLQGDFFLLAEIDSPFHVTGKETAKKLTFIKYTLKNDFIVSGYTSMKTKLKNDFILYGHASPITSASNYSEEDEKNDIESFSAFIDSNIEIDDII